MKINIKDILIRAGKTFLQATLGVLVISFQNGIDITNKEAMLSLLAGACAAGISAVMNLIMNSLKKIEA